LKNSFLTHFILEMLFSVIYVRYICSNVVIIWLNLLRLKCLVSLLR